VELHAKLGGKLTVGWLTAERLGELLWAAFSLAMASLMWTGRRIVRPLSAMARRIDCLIHQVA